MTKFRIIKINKKMMPELEEGQERGTELAQRSM